MSDIHNTKVRSLNMAAVHSKNTAPELWLRHRLHAAGYRYRIHVKGLPGSPDLVFPKYKCVIFVHGCFWHMHLCSRFSWPINRGEWWKNKIQGNYRRDLQDQDKLRELGWRVLIVWQCAIKGKDRIPEIELLGRVSTWLESGDSLREIPAFPCVTNPKLFC
ncbi:DNA mismatch endonuclease Vsr [Nissabacter archeti]|uniref:DNA mismatch endonuclease Vsr n=1 Tax=Nissabacter archeti TaxID=1917880 RepID=A0ABS5JN54_9GAMM|nr:DNA mismatch endonuclease Vsr [Nissabacter archeti]